MYIIFEGMDGSGKTTIMNDLANEVAKYGIHPILTHHPGSTPLGKYLRKLVKNPHSIDKNIDIDPLSRQLLYFTDLVNFTKTILIPSLKNDSWVFADRSVIISAIIYGRAEGLDQKELEILCSMISPPKADRLYILTCPPETAIKRINSTRSENDHYDNKPEKFFREIHRSYENLLYDDYKFIVQKVVSLDRVKYFDTTDKAENIISIMVKDLVL